MDNLISQLSAIRLSGARDAPPGFAIHRQQGNAAMLLPTDLIKQMQQEAAQQIEDEEAYEEEGALEACISEPAQLVRRLSSLFSIESRLIGRSNRSRLMVMKNPARSCRRWKMRNAMTAIGMHCLPM